MLERNHLEPCGSSSSHRSLGSFVKIMKALMGDVYAELYFLEIPSFDTERILFVERKKESKTTASFIKLQNVRSAFRKVTKQKEF